jgi:hypothetical protein
LNFDILENRQSKVMSNTYNIYLDESRIDNPEDNFMVVGGVFIDREKVKEITGRIKDIKEKHQFKGEIKWVKVDEKKKSFMQDLINYVIDLDSSLFSFHCIVVEKSKVKYDTYHQSDKELAFFKFIYELLEKRLKSGHNYYIFLDYKPTKIRERVFNLKTYLEKYAYFNKEDCCIKHFQAYPSQENIFIQLADLLCGAVGYEKNKYPKGTIKSEIVNFIAEKIGKDSLDFNSLPSESKFNIFHIKLE